MQLRLSAVAAAVSGNHALVTQVPYVPLGPILAGAAPSCSSACLAGWLCDQVESSGWSCYLIAKAGFCAALECGWQWLTKVCMSATCCQNHTRWFCQQSNGCMPLPVYGHPRMYCAGLSRACRSQHFARRHPGAWAHAPTLLPVVIMCVENRWHPWQRHIPHMPVQTACMCGTQSADATRMCASVAPAVRGQRRLFD